ncbi:MAG: polysaccharide biosynthesis C-terminal domain-containing protein [Ignavibacterium sp.]|nr:polysaccharide biosynthesis C-terminal domain-containing protein [Ignavibacterium sp.]MDW8375652.1 lipid II flippase MurJ [Ignavibacteriales bacterium]
MSYKSFIGRAAIIVTLISLLSRLLGFVREILFANYYGTNQEYDKYLVASIIPLTINTISIFFYQNYFIPNYAKVKNENEGYEEGFTYKIFIRSILFSIIILFFLINFRKQILYLYTGKSFVDYQIELIFIYFSLTIFPSIISSFFSAYLNIKNEFSVPSYSILSLNILTILAIIYSNGENIILISIGYLIGSILQLIFLVFKVDLSKITSGRYYAKNKLIKLSFNSFISVLLIESIGQLYSIADRYFYSELDSGGIASLNYATSIYLLPVTIFTFSLSTVIMPKISELFANKKIEEMNSILDRVISLSIFFFIPIIILFTFWGEKIVRIFFERGSFSELSTKMTTDVLFYLSLSLVFYVVYGLLNKYLYSLRESFFLLVITIMIIITKIIFNYTLVGYYKQNGLAISTTISYLLFFVLAFMKIKAKLDYKLNKKLFSDLMFYLFNTVLSSIIALILSSLINVSNIFHDYLFIIIFFVIYFINNMILGEKNQMMILSQIRMMIK